MKKCFVHVIHMVSITGLIHIVLQCRRFSVSAIVSVDLGTLGSMQNELSGEVKKVHVVKYYFDDRSSMNGMSVVEAFCTIIIHLEEIT